MGRLSLWWSQADHYDQLSSLLEARRMCSLARTIIAVIAGGLVFDALATIWTPTGPKSGVQIACALAASVGAAAGSLLWATRWPSREQAITFAVGSNASIALIALAQSDPIVAMFTCTTFAAMAFYIALFHTPLLMAYNFAVAIAVAALAGVRIAAAYNVVAAVCGLSLVLLLNLAVPFGIQAVVHVLGADAVRGARPADGVAQPARLSPPREGPPRAGTRAAPAPRRGNDRPGPLQTAQRPTRSSRR